MFVPVSKWEKICARIPPGMSDEINAVAHEWDASRTRTIAMLLRAGLNHSDHLCLECGQLIPEKATPGDDA